MEYVNRQGDRYYVFQGETKTGKPKYFASKRETSEKGVRVASLPGNLDIVEDPRNATVVVRRRKPSSILPAERDLVNRLATDLSAYSCVQTIVDGDRIVIYTPDTDPNATAAVVARECGAALSAVADWMMRHTNYRADLRFTIHDVDQRTYVAECYCYKSWVDGWIQIRGPASLESLVRKLVPHLGKDSFYESL